MSNAKPLSISLTKNFVKNQFGGYSIQHFWDYFIIENFPTKVIQAYIISTWMDIDHTFKANFKLVSPSGEELFSVEDDFQNENTEWNFICNYVPVFFWIRETGTHYLQVWVNEILMKQVPISVKPNLLLPNDETILSSLTNFMICQRGQFHGEFGLEIDNILTPSGLYNNGILAFLMTWSNVVKSFDVDIYIQDDDGNIVDASTTTIEKEHLPSYSVLSRRHLKIPSGLYWLVIMKEGKEELKHPILLFD